MNGSEALQQTQQERKERKERGAEKLARIPIKVQAQTALPKPSWIRVQAGNNLPRFKAIKNILREQSLHTVCEEAACPNIGECFSSGTATFMILGDLCTRRCPFCAVGHGKPLAPDPHEPLRLAQTVAAMQLQHVVITSVDRDDLRDGGAEHFVACIKEIRQATPNTRIEILVPDFRGRSTLALKILASYPPDVFNHNLETVPRLYRAVRPGADYAHSLQLLADWHSLKPEVPTKSGLMVGLGETDAEIIEVLQAMRGHFVAMLTLGQYLAPSTHHLPVQRYLPPDGFAEFSRIAKELGFAFAASGPLVRSSYHAGEQAQHLLRTASIGNL